MLRTRLASPLLLLAAAASIAAVFAVHRIEEGGGPLREPWATRVISPGTTEARIRFSTEQQERITIRIRDAEGRTVRRLEHDAVVDGPYVTTWDGTDDAGKQLPDGSYEVAITRAGDPRVYAPTRPIRIDTVPPEGRLLRAVVVDGRLGGRAWLEPGARLEVRTRDATPLDGLRAWRRASDEQPADAPDDAVVLRMSVRIPDAIDPAEDLHVIARDAAGNERDLTAAPDAPDVEVRS